MPDLPLCLGVLKHRASFLLMWCNFKFEGVLFRSDPTHNDRVDILLECATKQAVMTVTRWHRNQIIRGLWLLAKHKVEDGFMPIRAAIFEFDDVPFNLDTYGRM